MHWQLAINSTPVLIKKELPDSQSLQSIQVTDTFKQTNCFALPGYIQMNILPVTCSMHTSTRKLATPKQKKNKNKQTNKQTTTTTTKKLLCMFLSPMLHASMYAQITP